MSKRQPGLQYDKKTGEWSIDKRIKGYGRVRQRLQASSQQEAEMIFYRVISQIQGAVDRSNAGIITFREAGVKFIEGANKRSLDRDIASLEKLDPYIGNLPLANIHDESLRTFIKDRREAGIRSSTVTRDLAVVRSILAKAVRSWRNESGQPYLINPPLLTMPDWKDIKIPYPLNRDQQRKLLTKMSWHLKLMALFAVNTGLREQGVCMLRWDWEVPIPELKTSVFITPAYAIDFGEAGIWKGEKNDEDQVVVLNRIAKKVIEIQRARRKPGCPWVFPYRGKPLGKMNNTAWRNAWDKAELPTAKTILHGPHNLKHTFGRRLRSAGVRLETRKVLLHHTTGDVTINYSPADILELIEAAEKVVNHKSLLILRRSKGGVNNLS
jgi:integrase